MVLKGAGWKGIGFGAGLFKSRPREIFSMRVVKPHSDSHFQDLLRRMNFPL